ncbi:MAG: hypothetical protein LBP30_09025, partial [Clostridiales Family XIII bacterium]|nr:hypothetical protein [Clostridiales Family XIII bacterium]
HIEADSELKTVSESDQVTGAMPAQPGEFITIQDRQYRTDITELELIGEPHLTATPISNRSNT